MVFSKPDENIKSFYPSLVDVKVKFLEAVYRTSIYDVFQSPPAHPRRKWKENFCDMELFVTFTLQIDGYTSYSKQHKWRCSLKHFSRSTLILSDRFFLFPAMAVLNSAKLYGTIIFAVREKFLQRRSINTLVPQMRSLPFPFFLPFDFPFILDFHFSFLPLPLLDDIIIKEYYQAWRLVRVYQNNCLLLLKVL